MKRPTRYRRVARPAQSHGLGTLKFDWDLCFGEFKVYLAKSILKRLFPPAPDHELEERLEHHELAPGTFRVETAFRYLEEPKSAPFAWTAQSFRGSAGDARELASDEGAWRDWRPDLRAVETEATDDLKARIRRAVEEVLQQYGPEAALQALEQVRVRAEAARAALQAELLPWTTEDAHHMREASHELTNLGRPGSTLGKLLVWARPAISVERWLSAAQKNKVKRLLGEVEERRRLRYRNDLLNSKCAVLHHLLGRDRKGGWLDEVRHEVLSRQEFFEKLADTFASAPAARPAAGHEVRLVSGLEHVLDKATGKTCADLFRAELARAGCTLLTLAHEFQREPLVFHARPALPGEWPDHPLSAVREAFLARLDRALGVAEGRTPNLSQPRTPLDFLAGITLTHPGFAGILPDAVREWVRHSKPFGEYPRMTGVEPSVQRYLMCHPVNRAGLTQHLENQARPVAANHGDGDTSEYDLRNLYVAMLSQLSYGQPGHAQKTFHRGMHRCGPLHAGGEFEPLYDRRQFPEVRLLPEREDDHADSEQLFDALLRAREIHEFQPGVYCLTRPEEGLEPHFHETVIEPSWHPAHVIHDELRRGDFAHFVGMHLKVPGWKDLWVRLRDHGDAEAVAAQLVEHGVLEVNENQLYRLRIAVAPHDAALAPRRLYERKRGDLRGLDRCGFVAGMLKDDWFYNVAFWRAADALSQKRLQRDDVPEFLRGYVKNLEN